MDVAVRLAWTSAARRATGKPDAVGIRAPLGTVTGDPACRVHAEA